MVTAMPHIVIKIISTQQSNRHNHHSNATRGHPLHHSNIETISDKAHINARVKLSRTAAMSQQPHKNHTAIPRQSHSKMSSHINTAPVHNNSTTIPQRYHSDAAARPQQAHSKATGIPEQSQGNITAIQQHNSHSNLTAIKGKYHDNPMAIFS